MLATVPSKNTPRSTLRGTIIGGATLDTVIINVLSDNPPVTEFFTLIVNVYVTFWSPPNSLTGIPCNRPVGINCMPRGSWPETLL